MAGSREMLAGYKKLESRMHHEHQAAELSLQRMAQAMRLKNRDGHLNLVDAVVGLAADATEHLRTMQKLIADFKAEHFAASGEPDRGNPDHRSIEDLGHP